MEGRSCLSHSGATHLLWVRDEQNKRNNHTHASYIELYDPEHGDEQEVKGHKEAEGPPHVRDALFLPGFIRFHPGVDGGSVEGPQPSARQPGLGAAAAAALARHRLRRRPPALNRGRLVLNSGRDEDSLCHHCICRKEQGVVSAHLPDSATAVWTSCPFSSLSRLISLTRSSNQ